ncbi:TSSK6-activating co-chaperone protein isoform X1 [Ictidomys tridecemlineatus]|nr:TSSK6-activating co-chaperone protein isoform X1 [Ictidomys tridecemlineatus]
MMETGELRRLRNRVAAPGRVRRDLQLQRRRRGSGSWPYAVAHAYQLQGWVLGLRLSINTAAKEEGNAMPLCRAKPSPSFINLQSSSPPATFLNIQTTKLPSGVHHKPKECLGLLECMYANLQLQTQLAQQQMAILENLQASMSQLVPGRESKNSSLSVLSRNLLLNHLPQFRK